MKIAKNYIYIYICRIILILLFSVITLSLLTTKSEAATPYDSLTFNGEYYLNEYPDVKNAVGSGNYWGAYSHFVNYGINEGRRGSPYFDVRYYLNKYSDLQRAFGANYAGAYNHFVNCGINENRSGSPYIDPEYYASKYSDIRNAFGSDYSGIYNHFYTNGIKEGRRGSKYFDVGYYLNTNQDLLKAFGRGNYAAAFNHFLTCGINELRDPSSDINIDCYLSSYTDLQNAFGNNKNYRGLFEHCYTNSEIDKRTTSHKVVDITIKTEPTCTERGQVGGTKCERCGKIIVSPTYKPALGHDWEEPVFNWEGTDKCTVKFTCKRANHPQTLDAVITSEEKDGTVVYTATVTVDGETYTNVKNGSAVPGPGTGGTPSGGGGGSTSGGGGGSTGGGTVTPPTPQHTHTYGDPTWSWEGNTKATATFTCKDNDDTRTENASVSSNITKSATCTESGITTYTAKVNFNGKEYTNTTTNNKLPAATGHKWSSSFAKDTVNGFVKECTVCHVDDNEEAPTKLQSAFSVKNYTGEDFSENNYSKDKAGTWSLEKEITASETKGSLKNKVKEQTCSNKEGYYITITVKPVKLPTVSSTIVINPEITVTGDNGNVTEIAREVKDDGSIELLLELTRLDCKTSCNGSSCDCASGKSANCKCNKVITITVDGDGSNLGGYQPQTCTIDYCQLEFKKDFTVTFEYRDEINEKIEVEEGTKVTNEMLQTVDLQNTENIGNEFHEFKYWCEEKGDSEAKTYEKVEDLTNKTIDSDITLVPFFNLKVDDFIAAVVEDLDEDSQTAYSKDFSNEFHVTFDKGTKTITYDIQDLNASISKLDETSIPRAIAYILGKDEITEMTLSYNDKTAKFNKELLTSGVSLASNTNVDENLVAKIKDTTGKLVKEATSGATILNDLVKLDSTNKFKLSVTRFNNSLVNVTDANYNFDFSSKAILVKNEGELEAALQGEYETIEIGNSFEVTKQHDINRKVKITGKNGNEGNYTLTLNDSKKEDINSIFKVSVSDVEIDNITFKGSKIGILVEVNGGLNSTGLDLSGCSETGIEVKGKLDGTDLTYSSESYDNPVVRVPNAQKDTAKVTIKDKSGNKIDNSTSYLKVIKHDKKWCNCENKEHKDNIEGCPNISWSDEYTEEHRHDKYYYLSVGNKKEYYYIMFKDGNYVTIVRLVEKDKAIDLPIDFNTDEYTTQNAKKTKNEKKIFKGWTKSGSSQVITNWDQEIADVNSKLYFSVWGNKE